ncbi:MAG: Lrp/AsnC family transcriptional regulator [Candidatus Aenigmarchaeota archaeon]|nr:Lrp/AsnC family transcriptional regulator [Candidatus Aenigmarchaeota archaeon]MCK5235311.1 Lrp/AsnC family transcriptional regulator [Candidatus Aenigmarchaeota archaeon]
MLKKKEKDVLLKLVENGRKTDKQIAKELNTTQPTVTRIRQKLERENYILKYYASPAFKKIGMNIIVITIMQWTDYSKAEELKNFIKDIKANNNVICFARGNGLSGRTAFFVSAHKDMKSYEDFVVDIKSRWSKYIREIDQFISSIENVFKPFDHSGVASMALKEE